MSKLLFFIFFTTSISSFSQEILILDRLLKTPIKNVNLICKQVGVSTGEKGIVDISIFKETDTIKISHLSYNPKQIIKSTLKGKIFVSLQPKIKILETVVFIEDKAHVIGWEIIYGAKTANKNIVTKSTAELVSTNNGITMQES